MANESLEKWRGAAMALESAETAWPAPYYVLTTEATHLAAAARKYWEPQVDSSGRILVQGLASARLDPVIVNEVLELVEATQQAQSAQVMTLPAMKGAELERARWLVGEIRSALEFYFADGVTDENDQLFSRMLAEHDDDPNTIAALAAELADYVALAEGHRAALDGLGGFNAANLDEAKPIVVALRERGAAQLDRAASAAAIDLRNRMLTLLMTRVSEVRRAARFVFRERPEIVRLFTSAYERRRRASARREAEAVTRPTATDTTATPAQIPSP